MNIVDDNMDIESDIITVSTFATSRKRRTTEERALSKIRKQQYSHKLVPGKEISALAAMCILNLCRRNMPRVNMAFRQMVASRIIFPPKQNINKFATGGIAEECTSQLFCDIGLTCLNNSNESNVVDLEIHVEVNGEIFPLNVSIKNSGKLTSQPILENYRGQKRHEIRRLPPTFIIYTEMEIRRARIIYIDDEILRQGYDGLTEEEFHDEVYQNCDSNLTFRSGFLKHFIPRLPSEYILNAEYPDGMPPLEEQSFCKLALKEVMRQLYN